MTNTRPDVALVLATISSKTRVRLNVRDVEVESPAEHAARLLRFLTHVMGEPYLASPEHSERVLTEFNQMEQHLTEVAS
jgi:hypothetical protein